MHWNEFRNNYQLILKYCVTKELLDLIKFCRNLQNNISIYIFRRLNNAKRLMDMEKKGLVSYQCLDQYLLPKALRQRKHTAISRK